ncbi:uncharacterized protein LOC126898200 [Daktulosphaira vitifoliae]|uniref:uncharacterized protein LOC126898200 n=1 Tax=Daktulosphaira vitifoliae TaxID=58002 RepID=UPI0021A9DE9C|nr:uncharacterized protein LOC126898200 [Daktulosphaira vitifoliae]
MRLILINLLMILLYFNHSTAYIYKVLENDSVCSISFISNNLNLIGREDQSAMVIKESRYFHHWSGQREFKCRFTVTSTLGLGIFAVIQRLSFRRNSKGQCIDYIQFRHAEKTISFADIFNVKIKSSEKWGDKICGKIDALEVGIDAEEFNSNSSEEINEDKQVMNSFIDNRGLLEVVIHIGNKSLEEGEELNFEIVFTAYQQDCRFESNIWKSCGSKTCIYKDFFNDGKLNCPYKSCKDEGGCRSVFTLNGNSDRFDSTFGTKILAGTVAGLFTMFVAFIAFLWLFRHCGTVFCCLSPPNPHPHSSEMQPVPNIDNIGIMASAPPDSVVASGAEIRAPDKDLPPSYESLFPDK